MVAIGLQLRIEFDRIGDEARADGREHGVRDRRLLAEEPGTAILVEAFGPDFLDALDIGARAGEDLEALVTGADIHRQRRAHVLEAGMHFARNCAAMGAGRLIVGQQTGGGVPFVHIFGNCQRIPDRDHAVRQPRHENRRREKQQFLAVLLVRRCHDLGEFQTRHLAQKPAAQRPRGVVLGRNGQFG